MPREMSEEVKRLMGQGLSYDAARMRVKRQGNPNIITEQTEQETEQDIAKPNISVRLSDKTEQNKQTEHCVLVRLRDAMEGAERAKGCPLDYAEKEEVAESVRVYNDGVILSVMQSRGVCYFEARERLGDPISEYEQGQEAKRTERCGRLKRVDGETFRLSDGERVPIYRRVKEQAAWFGGVSGAVSEGEGERTMRRRPKERTMNYNPPILSAHDLGLDETRCACGHPRYLHYEGELAFGVTKDGHCQRCECESFRDAEL